MNTDEIKKKRLNIRNSIYTTAKRKDSIEKFERLIKLSKEYKELTYKLVLSGNADVEIRSDKLRSDYWKNKYDEYLLEQQVEKTELNKKVNKKWNITLCWSARPDYCICDNVVDKVRKYLIEMGLKHINDERTEFDDRLEFREVYQFNGPKVLYDTYLKSAEYILTITADSIHDVCNVGVYGKKIE
jgi:hypothetical protein